MLGALGLRPPLRCVDPLADLYARKGRLAIGIAESW